MITNYIKDYSHIISCYIDAGYKHRIARYEIYHFETEGIENDKYLKEVLKLNKENDNLYVKILQLIQEKGWYFVDEIQTVNNNG